MQNWVTIIFVYGKIIIYEITFMIEISFSDAHAGKNKMVPKIFSLTNVIVNSQKKHY